MTGAKLGLCLALVSASLAGCSGITEDEAPTDVLASYHWSDLKDGSSFASIETQGGKYRSAIRCWPVNTGGFSCISVGEHEAGGFRITSVALKHEDTLPEKGIGLVDASDGYSCRNMLADQEQIDRAGHTLISNIPEKSGRVWSGSYVSGFMKDNGVAGTNHFDCLQVLKAIRSGSLETLGTTAVTKAVLS